MTTETARIPWLSAEELARAYRARELSPVEVTRALLERIERLNPRLHAYLVVDADGALAAARAAEKAIAAGDAGPLTGVPISIKDLLDMRGFVTTSGSLALRDNVAEQDSIMTERLRRAGTVILGKTNTPEFGVIATTENRLGPPCANPWNLGYTPGGSSGGASAAVAAGLGPIGVGTDGGGSIRMPAAHAGVFGLKATYGRIARSGHSGMPLFSHTGPLTRTVADAALMLDATSGPHPRDVTAIDEPPPAFRAALEQPLPRLRAAWWAAPWGRMPDPELLSLVERAARSFTALGIEVEEAHPETEDWAICYRPLMAADEYAAARDILESRPQDLSGYARETLEAGRGVPVHAYSAALRGRERFRYAMAEFFRRYDLMLTPVTALPATPIDRPPETATGPAGVWPSTPYTAPFNITGQPAASVPCGFTAAGLPVGLHVVGRWGDEVTVLQACAAFERAHPWTHRLPPLGE